MKKILLFAAVAIFMFTAAQSQELRIGFKAGVNLSSLVGENTDDYEMRPGFHIGGLVEIPISEKFAVQPELLYSSQGAKLEFNLTDYGITSNYITKIKLDYINIPIIAKYYVIEGLSLEAGPQLGILVNAENKYEVSGGGLSESNAEGVKDNYNTFDIGFALGAAYRLSKGIFFSARYVIGIGDVAGDIEHELGSGVIELETFKQRNNVFQVSAGFSF